MTISQLLTTTARPALAARTTGPLMLRGPQVTFAPDDDLDPAFVEQPGDREPDPDASEAEAEPEPEAAEEPEAEVAEEAAEDAPEFVETDDKPDGESTDEERAAEEAAKPAKNWKDRQIIKLRAKEKADAEEKARLKAENEELKAAAAGGADGATVLTDTERAKIRQEAAAEIRQQDRVTAINKGADAMFDAGVKAFPKTWEKRVADAAEVFSDEIRAKPEFLEAITELDNAAAVYHDLAGDPDKMEEVLNLPPHKMGMELARLSAKLSAAPKPKPISRAPAPIKPLDKPGVQDRSLEDLANDQSPAAQAEFFRRMDAEDRKRAEAR